MPMVLMVGMILRGLELMVQLEMHDFMTHETHQSLLVLA